MTLIIGSLGAGGAERVLSTMANYWAAAGHEITLITIESSGNDFYPIDSRVERIGLGLMGDSPGLARAIGSNVTRVRALRGAVVTSRPDIVISFVEGVNVYTLLSTRLTHIPVIVSERIDPRVYSAGRAYEFLRKLVYPWASALVVQSEAVKPWAAALVGQAKTHVIPNPARECAPSSGNTTSTIVAMGRLTRQKGFDLLITAFAEASAAFPEWRLAILGAGEERESLLSLIRELNLSGRVEMPGRVSDPDSILSSAGIFVLSSRFEGFPNALMEAMACGLPCISFDCPSGPREILRHETDGLLVPPENVAALTAAMKRLMSSPGERKLMGERAREVTKRFGLTGIMAKWDGVVAEVVS